MPSLRLIFADQLSTEISALKDCNKSKDLILMCEVMEEATYVKHHKKKIAFLFSAMRHFHVELLNSNFRVLYIKLNDPKNTGSFKGEVERCLSRQNFDKIIVTYPGEYRVLNDVKTWENSFSMPVEIREDSRFFCRPEDFQSWAKGRKQLRMEYFYREMRQRFKILMDGVNPLGGKWNFDIENRRPPKKGLNVPPTFSTKPDLITLEVLRMVDQKFKDHFGSLEHFNYAVTRSQAKEALKKFIEERMVHFGEYQDAMIEGEPWMYHAQIGLYLNCGLLSPLECVEAAEQAYHDGRAPLNSVEGFIRQIIGWREYMRGIYWLKMPTYANENFLNAKRALPRFYWDAETKMNCLKQCVSETRENAYAHHIQRLMILGNFALIAGLSPKAVNEWFLAVYTDAYEWVELPNVSGMALFADGGFLASKPYAAGGSYINKMSNYCEMCSYKVAKKNGSDACPFNYLYWDFLVRNRGKLSPNPRVGMIYRTYDRMAEEKKKAISIDSNRFLESLVP